MAGWEFRVDWNKDGDWSTGNDDVTAVTLAGADVAFTIERGTDNSQFGNPPMAGEATFELISDEQNSYKYDPENTTGPLYQKLLPGRPTRIRAFHAGSTYDLFRGFLDDFFVYPHQWPQKVALSALDIAGVAIPEVVPTIDTTLSAFTTTTGSVGVSIATTPSTDQFMLLIGHLGAARTMTPTAGWTLIESRTETVDNDRGAFAWYRIATTTDAAGPTTYTITDTGGVEEKGAALMLFSNVDIADPIGTDSTNESHTNDPTPTARPVSPSSTDSMVFLVNSMNGFAASQLNAPSGYTQPYSNAVSGLNSQSAYKVVATTSTESPGPFQNTANFQNDAVTLSFTINKG